MMTSEAHVLVESHACTLLVIALAGQPLLLPLTQSLYVSGSVASVESVLVDVGTGYYVEVGAGL